MDEKTVPIVQQSMSMDELKGLAQAIIILISVFQAETASLLEQGSGSNLNFHGLDIPAIAVHAGSMPNRSSNGGSEISVESTLPGHDTQHDGQNTLGPSARIEQCLNKLPWRFVLLDGGGQAYNYNRCNQTCQSANCPFCQTDFYA